VTDNKKESSECYLVNADTIEQAQKDINESLGKTMTDFTIKKIEETRIMDVFEYKES